MESLIPALCPKNTPRRVGEEVVSCIYAENRTCTKNCELQIPNYICTECKTELYLSPADKTNLTCRQDGCGGIIKLITS